MRALRAQDGDIIVSWLVRLLLTIAAVALIAFEVGAVVFAHLDADEAAREVARTATVAYGASGSVAEAQDAAADAAEERGVTLVTFELEETTLVVEVERTAQTLVLHRIPALSEALTRVGERRAEIGA